MIPFITYREPDEVGRLCFYILQKAHPHYVGLLVTSPRQGALLNIPVPGHNLWLTYAGCLIGNVVPGYIGFEAEVNSIFVGMAEWYYLNRIKTDPKKYDKFKIKNDTVTGR